MYQLYTVSGDGGNAYLVAVAYPKGGGSALVERRVNLSSIGCQIVNNVDRHSLGATEVGINNVTDHGLELEIVYENTYATITPLSVGGPIKEKTVRYSFDMLGIKYDPNSPIQKAKTEDKFYVTPDTKPISDKKYRGRDR